MTQVWAGTLSESRVGAVSDVQGEDEVMAHRVYDMEVIELSDEVSFLLLLPPVESVCIVPGETKEVKKGHLFLPGQIFEMSKFCFVLLFLSRARRSSG